MKRSIAVAILVGLVAAIPAAPVPKEPHYGPVTAEQRKESMEKLKQIGIGMQNYHDACMNLPPDFTSKTGKPLLSWRVAILPWIKEGELYNQFKLDEPWDSENNKQLIEKMPKIYAPIRVKAKPGETFYQAFSGKACWLRPGEKPFTLATVRDGTSNTIAVVEAGEPVIWSKPSDIPYDPKKPMPKLGGMFNGEFHVVFLDGHVAKWTAKEEVLRGAITPDGGETLEFPD